MKKSLLASASVGAIVLATGAHAADLSRPVYKAPALAPAPWSWTGFYVGGNVGVASAHSSIADDPSTFFDWLGHTTTSADKNGVIGGLQIGYNWQISQFVLGIEGDISFASLDRSTVASTIAPIGFVETYSSRLDTLGTIRGRIGLAFDRALIYGTGGVAFARLKDELTDTVFPFTASPGSNVTGWTAGGGIEYAFADHWSAKVEYLHVGFPDRTANANFAPVSGYAFRFKDSLDIARVGINYKF